MRLRADLFDRRFNVYGATLHFLVQVLQRADKADPETERAFLVVLDQARLLFRPEVHTALEAIWRDYCQFRAVKSTMKANFERTGAYGQAEIEAEYQYNMALGELLPPLSGVFGDELMLGSQRYARLDIAPESY